MAVEPIGFLFPPCGDQALPERINCFDLKREREDMHVVFMSAILTEAPLVGISAEMAY